MAQFRSLASRFSALFRRRELGRRIDEELQFHLQIQTEENIQRGMDLPDAQAATRSIFVTKGVLEAPGGARGPALRRREVLRPARWT